MLRDTLHTLAQQTFPAEFFEVIVVDDGSEDGTQQITRETYPFQLIYLRQSNQGDAAARNLGASRSNMDILLFLDDDILIETNFLVNLICQHNGTEHRIVVGTERLLTDGEFPRNGFRNDPDKHLSTLNDEAEDCVRINFTEVCSNNLSIRKDEYFALGAMQGLDFPGSSIWCDVDFSYRAYTAGYEFFRSTRAICWHRDYVIQNLETHSRRMHEAAYRAVSLFQKYPDLPSHIQMLNDKQPIHWLEDPPRLILRKSLRRISANRPIIWLMTELYNSLKKLKAPVAFLTPLYRWIIGAHLYRGYRFGLRDLS